MWNVAYVQKHTNYTWQEWVRDKTREISKSSSMANEKSEIATTVQ